MCEKLIRDSKQHFSKNNINIDFIGSTYSTKIDEFLNDLTSKMFEFNFPTDTFLILDNNKKIFKFKNKKNMSQLISAYTDICIEDNGILSLPESSFFIRNYAFEVE